MTDEEPVRNPCPTNPKHEKVSMTIWYTDSEGNQMEEPDYCVNCYEESLDEYREKLENATSVEFPELMEEYEEKLREVSPTSPDDTDFSSLKGKRERDYDFIEKYSARLAEITNAPINAARAMIQFDISIALHKLYYANGKGRLMPNIGFIWLGPSGSYKTPLYDWGIKHPYRKAFREWGYFHFNRIGGRALISSISKVRKEDMIEGKVLAMVTLDEATTLAKDSNADGLSDSFEAFAQAYDGQLASSDTIIRKHEEPHPSYSPIWFQGTPVFLKYVNEDFWDIGMGNRMFFIRYTTSEPLRIPREHKSKEFYDDMLADLELMTKYTLAKFDDDAWERYNEYQINVLKEVQKVQSDLESAVDSNNFAIASRVKIPTHVIKLAIIFAASRFSIFPEKAFSGKKVLKIEMEDLERAIDEVEMYHANMVHIHTIWENQSAQRLKHESVEMLANKIFNHIMKMSETGNAFVLTYHKEEDFWKAEESKEGRWVKHSVLLKKSHMKATGLKSFQEIIDTLKGRDELMDRSARWYYTDSNGKITYKEVLFYKLKD